MKKQSFLWIFSITLAMLFVISCESVFPDARLDNFWKLDRISYLDSDGSGTPVSVNDTVSGVFWGFAAHLVQIEKHSIGMDVYGVTVDEGDSLKIDFSGFNGPGGQDKQALQSNLRLCGVDSLVSRFCVTYPDRKSMVLSGKKTRLNFVKW